MEFNVQHTDLKKILKIFSSIGGGTERVIESQALVRLNNNKTLSLYATDRNRIASGRIPVQTNDTEGSFTINPKKMLALINSSNVTDIRISYEEENNSIKIYASDNPDSYVTFASLDTNLFVSFEYSIISASETGKVNAGAFLSGLKFIRTYLSQDEKNQKYGRACFQNSACYGSNGANKIGVYKSPDFSCMDNISIPKIMINSVIQFIDVTESKDITIKTTNNFIMFFSDDDFMFGFLKNSNKIPAFPILLEKPKANEFIINRIDLEKKLSRLILSGDEGLEISVTDILKIKTIGDRSSLEILNCEREKKDPFEFIISFNPFKDILSSFLSDKIQFFIDPTRLTIWDSSIIEIEEKNNEITKSEFTAIAVIPLSRRI